MAAAGSGAVFFLGTRAHYQVLQQPDTRFDSENGNASTETIYQNPSVQELWPADQSRDDNERWGYSEEVTETKISRCVFHSYDSRLNKMRHQSRALPCNDNIYCMQDEKEKGDSTLRSRRRASTAALCEPEDMQPKLLNAQHNSTTKSGKGRSTLLALLWSLARRKRRLDHNEIHYLHHIDNALTACTYRESCRCLECQSRYFECDEDSEDYTSDEEDYVPRYVVETIQQPPDDEDDDEVFVDTVPEDNTSTDLLLEDKKMSVSSDEVTEPDPEDNLQLEVAAGTPVLLNYLLTHPITCAIQ